MHARRTFSRVAAGIAVLGKSLPNVFPITYITPFVFEDGHPLRGQVD